MAERHPRQIMMNNMTTWMGSGSGGMHGSIWYWTVIGILVVAVIVFVIRTITTKQSRAR
jgi:hypothetical protein